MLAILVIWEAVAASGILFRDVVPSIVAIGRALAELLFHPDLKVSIGWDRFLRFPRSTGISMSPSRGGDRARDRRHSPVSPSVWRSAPIRSWPGVRALSLLSRADAEDRVLPGDDHVVRRRPGIQGRDGHGVVLLPGGAQRRRRHAPDRRRADPRRPELPPQHLADGHQDLSAGDARADHQRRAARHGRCHDRHAAGRDQAVQQGHRLHDHRRLQHLQHAAHVCGVAGAVRASRSAPTAWSAVPAADSYQRPKRP